MANKKSKLEVEGATAEDFPTEPRMHQLVDLYEILFSDLRRWSRGGGNLEKFPTGTDEYPAAEAPLIVRLHAVTTKVNLGQLTREQALDASNAILEKLIVLSASEFDGMYELMHHGPISRVAPYRPVKPPSVW